ncbi:MAG TPA: helix-turn-helix transcriptional regulator [Gemmatimonadaceae bacterium]|nr:helix-turn-helix transcriptional regulator [Gemmatimonadaceae bacterium]
MSSVHTPEYQFMLQRLQDAREELELTQQQVADALEKKQSFVSKCETGERRVDVIELARFAALYGKPLSYFLPTTFRPPGKTLRR